MTINTKVKVVGEQTFDRFQVCSTNIDSGLLQTTKSITDCCGTKPAYSGSNTANFNDRVTTIGTNGGPSSFGCYDMMGQVDEWLHDINPNRNNPCNTTYLRADRFSSNGDIFTGEEIQTSSYVNNGVRLISKVPYINIYNKNLELTDYIVDSGNTINSNNKSNWNNTRYGNLTSVGTNGRPSYWGTFDQGGLVWEFTTRETENEIPFDSYKKIVPASEVIEIIGQDEFGQDIYALTETEETTINIPIYTINNKRYNYVDSTIKIAGGSFNDTSLCSERDGIYNFLDRGVESFFDHKVSFGLRLCSETCVVNTDCYVTISGGLINNYNTSNYNNTGEWKTQEGYIIYLTTVGTNGKPSNNNTYDQDGLVWEWSLRDSINEYIPVVRGGAYSSNTNNIGADAVYIYNEDSHSSQYIGLRLAGKLESDFSSFVYVGGGNPEIIGRCGTNISSVQDFYIQKYPTTNLEYVNFLNIVDSNGNKKDLYFNNLMTIDNGGINYLETNEIGNKYLCKKDMERKPVVGLNINNVARLVNWLNNSLITDKQSASTESGIYTLGSAEILDVTNNGTGNYVINREVNPTLTLIRGRTYTFNITAVGHRFWIKTDQSIGDGNKYSTGVKNNGTDNGTITFTVPLDAPNTLYYNCELHNSMKGTINIVSPSSLFSKNSNVANYGTDTILPVTKDAASSYNGTYHQDGGVFELTVNYNIDTQNNLEYVVNTIYRGGAYNSASVGSGVYDGILTDDDDALALDIPNNLKNISRVYLNDPVILSVIEYQKYNDIILEPLKKCLLNDNMFTDTNVLRSTIGRNKNFRRKLSDYFIQNDQNNHMGFRLCSNYEDPLDYKFQLDQQKTNLFLGIIPEQTDNNYTLPELTNTTSQPENVFSIMRYSITNTEYLQYLNRVDPYGENSKCWYDEKMLIKRSSGFYTCENEDLYKPVTGITLLRAIRYCNYMHNIVDDIVDTETGSYSITDNNNLLKVLSRISSEFNTNNGFTTTETINPLVHCVSIQADGKILIGGNFTSYNGLNYNKIIRLNTDGTEDSSFNIQSGFNGIVKTIAIQSDGKIIVGGEFTQYQDKACSRIVRLNVDGTLDSNFGSLPTSTTTPGFYESVNKIILQKNASGVTNEILVCGNFTKYNNVSAFRLVRLTISGQLDTNFNIQLRAGFDNEVNDIALLKDGKIMVGGAFTKYDQQPITGLVRLNSNGSRDTTFANNSFNNTVLSLAVDYGTNDFGVTGRDKIYVGGSFTKFADTDINRIIKLNYSGNIDTSFNVENGFDGAVRQIQIQNKSLFIGGRFNKYKEKEAKCIIKLTIDGNIDDYGFNEEIGITLRGTGGVRAISVIDQTKILIAGDFLDYAGTTINGVVMLKQSPEVGTSIVRNSSARYWIPSQQEWFYAAYRGAGRELYRYATNTNNNPNKLYVNSFWIPTESEWYTAAYYSQTDSVYKKYATAEDSLPSGLIAVDTNGDSICKSYRLSSDSKLQVNPDEEDLSQMDLVPYNYQIARYNVTNSDYVKFLNEVDPNGENKYITFEDVMSNSNCLYYDSSKQPGYIDFTMLLIWAISQL